MSIIAGNPPVLIGPVPLFYVQSMVLSDGYKIEKILGSKFAQAVAPTAKTISIEAVLIGRERLVWKVSSQGIVIGGNDGCDGGADVHEDFS